MNQKNELMRGAAEPVILKLLSEKSTYGYEMIKLVNERTGGLFQWREGSLYPCLHRMEAEGLIQSFWQSVEDKNRKYYAITKKGKKAAEEKITEAKQFCSALNNLLTLN